MPIVVQSRRGAVLKIDHIDCGHSGQQKRNVIVENRTRPKTEHGAYADLMRRKKEFFHQLLRAVARHGDVQIFISDHIEQDHRLNPIGSAASQNLLRQATTAMQAVGRAVFRPALLAVKKRHEKFGFERRTFRKHSGQLQQDARAGPRIVRALKVLRNPRLCIEVRGENDQSIGISRQSPENIVEKHFSRRSFFRKGVNDRFITQSFQPRL